MPGPDFGPAILEEMAENCHTYTPAKVVPTKVTQVDLNSLFAELSSLVDKVAPFTAYVHLRRCAESLREAAT
jgi:hypothetical protein